MRELNFESIGSMNGIRKKGEVYWNPTSKAARDIKRNSTPLEKGAKKEIEMQQNCLMTTNKSNN